MIDPAAPTWERDALSLLDEVVSELIDGVTTTTPVSTLVKDPTDTQWGWRRVEKQHVVEHACLLEQLGRAIQSSTVGADDTVRQGPGSKPSARLDALEVVQRVERESTTWALRLGLDARQPVQMRLRALVPSAVPGEFIRDDRGRTLLQAARSWRAAARVTTGWDSRPFAPRVPCPEVSCEEVGSLRVRLSAQTAVCLRCGATWDEDLVEGLAFYCAWAAEHELHTAVRPLRAAVLGPGGVEVSPAVESVHEVLVPVLDDDGQPVLERGRPVQQLVPCGDCAQAREQMVANRAARAAAAAAHVTTGELMPVLAVEGALHADVLVARARHERQQATA